MAPLQAGEGCIKAVFLEVPLMFGLNTVISFLDRHRRRGRKASPRVEVSDIKECFHPLTLPVKAFL
jgi:hypothetical protein